MANSDIKIEIATPAHRDGILLVAKDVFIKNEPVSSALNASWDKVRLGWEKTVDSCVQVPHSHVAVNTSGIVVGFRMSRILNLENYAPNESLNEFIPPGRVKTIVDHLTKDWATLLINDDGQTCKKLLQFLALSVHPDCGGKGLGEKMCRENLALGERLGCEYCLVVGSNWMSQRIFEKIGFTTVASIEYADLKDENGQRPFEVADPKQKSSKGFIKKLGN